MLLMFWVSPFFLIAWVVAGMILFGDRGTGVHPATEFVIIVFNAVIGAAIGGLLIGLFGFVRRDEIPRLGAKCALGHALMILLSVTPIFLVTKQRIEFNALIVGEPYTPGKGVTLEGVQPSYEIELPAPWQAMPLRSGFDKMATPGKGIILGIRANPRSRDLSEVLFQFLDDYKNRVTNLNLLAVREATIAGRPWLRMEIATRAYGVPQLTVMYFYCGKEGGFVMSCQMPANLRNTEGAKLDEELSKLTIPASKPANNPEQRSVLISRIERDLAEGRTDRAFRQVHDASAHEAEGVLAWLLENEETLDTPFLFEIANRLSGTDPRRALWHWMRARMRAEYEAGRTLAPDARDAVAALEADIAPGLPVLAQNRPELVTETAPLALLPGVLERVPGGVPMWLREDSPTLREEEKREKASGGNFQEAKWLKPEAEWEGVRNSVLQTNRKKFYPDG